MGPKKGKDPTEDGNYWRTCIEEAPLDDDTWKVKVVLIEAAGSDQDRMYLDRFETYAAEERRFVIKNICKTETIFMVNQLGGEKKVKDDNLRVFEEGQAYLKDKKDIPADILALIIKHLILKMKSEYLFIKHQRLEVKEGIQRESATMINRAEVRGTVNVKQPEPAEPPEPPAKGKKGETEVDLKAFEIDENKKYNTMLRVRGEEWRDKVYIDDYPIDGPNLYVAVTGFVEPDLAGWLIKIGIPLTAVVQVRIDSSDSAVPSNLYRASKRGQSQTELLMEKSLKFWEDLQQLRIHKETADDFKNTAFVVFTPPYWDTDELSGSPEKIYDELCYLLYDVQDLTRQHVNFIENMDIINIPEENKNDRYQNYYNKLIEEIPLECVNTYLVLDSIIQVVCNCDIMEESSTGSLSTTLIFNPTDQNMKDDDKIRKAENLVKDVMGQLCKTDIDKKKYRLTYGEEYESHKNPIVIIHGDICKYNTFHLGNINLDDIVWSMLFGMPIHSLFQNRSKATGEIEAKINFHVNVLLSCFDRNDVETAELDRLLHILACRKLYNNRSSLKKHHLMSSNITEFKKTYLKRSILAEPLTKSSVYKSGSSISHSFPSIIKSLEGSSKSSLDEDDESTRIKFLFDCPDISELVSAAEIANEKPISHMIENYEFFEDFNGTCAFQILLEAFNSFNCVDYKYCEVTDCIILMFFNSHDKEGVAREDWRCHISTPLCLQDFFDFVLEEHIDWVQKEEKAYDENMMLKSLSECKDSKDLLATKTCVENLDVDMELLIEGSLKFEEFNKIEAVSEETSESKLFSEKKINSPRSTIEADSRSSKKTKTTANLTPKFETEKNAEEEKIKKPFSGYDLGDRRVEVFGKDSIYFSKDGTRVSSFYSLLIPMNLEYVILNVKPGYECNEFWMHKALGDSVTPDVIDMCESFRIKCKDDVTVYLKKQLYQVPVPVVNTSRENTKTKDITKSPDTSNIIQEIFNTKSFHSFYVTWPNGFITESVHENNSPTLSHIKQYNSSQSFDDKEEMRCISLNGEVIVFLTNGDIEILKPDSTYIKITKCEKRSVAEEVEDINSIASSDKSKKGKGKEKGKEKLSKTSSKTSKNIFDDTNIKPVEFELVIDEFESIEPNGLRQRCIEGDTIDIEKLLIRIATDYCLGEVFSKRMDGTTTLLNKDGIHIVTFPNNTRILTKFIIEDAEVYPEWTLEEIEYLSMFAFDVEVEALKSKSSISQKSFAAPYSFGQGEESNISEKLNIEEEVCEEERKDGYISVHIIYTIEHANFTTITIDKSNDKILVESPNNSRVTYESNGNYEFTLDSQTSAKFDGENLNISYEACPECKSFTSCNVKIKSEELSSVTQMQRNWLKMNDSLCKKIVVNEEGNINIVQESCCDNVFHDKDSVFSEELTNSADQNNKDRAESSISPNGKCRENYEAKALRFFVLRRELTCSELVHRALIEQYKSKCRWKPWCSINQYDTFGDHRTLWSILSPVQINETEKWLMESKLANKPKHLTYKDLEKVAGKGFYHWMRPYKRFQPKPIKPDNVLPERLPRAYVLRTLEQQWRDGDREELKGAKELLNAILRYRHVMEADSELILNVPIYDPRPEDERTTGEIVQAIAHKVYEDLKNRLKEDVQSRARPSITTKPAPPEDLSIQGEVDEDDREEFLDIEEEANPALKEADSAVQMSSNLKRYWRRRAEEYKEEQFYRYLLREGSVPPYFRNVLGGAIWWEMNNTTDEAVTKSERRKMKCVCEEESSPLPENPSEI
ncbi:hypothetical protein KGM_206139 [Danaus plexippus plexippus]|uniref:Uncharacterized protein n=1 Tax=Danaus plexippus plexippus TaxID=278856 RepID=A0A212EGL1_DANPL|nr:hypothetical protein KGM_206139 [Danaus plexippus plexippus]